MVLISICQQGPFIPRHSPLQDSSYQDSHTPKNRRSVICRGKCAHWFPSSHSFHSAHCISFRLLIGDPFQYLTSFHAAPNAIGSAHQPSCMHQSHRQEALACLRAPPSLTQKEIKAESGIRISTSTSLSEISATLRADAYRILLIRACATPPGCSLTLSTEPLFFISCCQIIS